MLRCCGISVFGYCFVIYHFVSVLQSSWCGIKSWSLYLNCLPDVLWVFVLCGFSSQCFQSMLRVWFWYFINMSINMFALIFLLGFLNRLLSLLTTSDSYQIYNDSHEWYSFLPLLQSCIATFGALVNHVHRPEARVSLVEAHMISL